MLHYYYCMHQAAIQQNLAWQIHGFMCVQIDFPQSWPHQDLLSRNVLGLVMIMLPPQWWDIHEKMIETITTRIFYLKFKENNKNYMNEYAFCFDFCCFFQPSRIGQNMQPCIPIFPTRLTFNHYIVILIVPCCIPILPHGKYLQWTL